VFVRRVIEVTSAVNTAEAVALIHKAIPRRGGTWADLGAGEGVFTRALVELVGPDGRVYALDRDPRAVAALKRWATSQAGRVIPVVADFSRPFELPGLDRAQLDGMLLANALHFVRDAGTVLARLATWLRPGGRVVLVEYDRRGASRWVPHPIPAAHWSALAASAGLSGPVITATRPSAFGGDMYVATADLPADVTTPRR
jgi:ubiquinone/menaquinone biosynthesis C-methylase UbiE